MSFIDDWNTFLTDLGNVASDYNSGASQTQTNTDIQNAGLAAATALGSGAYAAIPTPEGAAINTALSSLNFASQVSNLFGSDYTNVQTAANSGNTGATASALDSYFSDASGVASTIASAFAPTEGTAFASTDLGMALTFGADALSLLSVAGAVAALGTTLATNPTLRGEVEDWLDNEVSDWFSPSNPITPFMNNLVSQIEAGLDGSGATPLERFTNAVQGFVNNIANLATSIYDDATSVNGQPAQFMRWLEGLYYGSWTDPIVLGLNGSSIQLTSLAQSNAYFDINDTGFAVHTGWFGPETGVLVNDPGGDQSITSAADFFGSDSTDGFTALSALDVYDSGVLSSSDPGWADLYVWTDTNGNGVVDPGELQSLSSLGITSIDLDATPVNEDINGNYLGAIATFNYANGTSGTVAEAYLENDTLDSTYTGSYTINPAVFGLPDLRGYGTVPNLAIAMSQDSTLLTLVQDFVADSDSANWSSEVQAILYEWTGVEDVDPTSSGPNVNAQQLGALEALFGGNFENLADGGNDPNSHQGGVLTNVWNQVFLQLATRLIVQGPAASAFSGVLYNVTSDSFSGAVDPASFASALATLTPSGATAAENFWANFSPIAANIEALFAQSSNASYSAYVSALQSTLTPLDLPFTADQALGGVFIGSSGSDDFSASSGADAFFDGMGGNDVERASGAADTFVFNSGYGQLEIDQQYTGNAYGNSILRLGTGITPSDITLANEGDNLILTDGVTGDSIQLDNELLDGGNSESAGQTAFGIQEVQFADGTVWTLAQLVSNAQANVITYDPGQGALDINQFNNGTSAGSELQFGAGITPSDIAVTGDGYGDLILTDGINGDQITLDSALLGTAYGVQSVTFSDGTTWSWQQMADMATVGSAENTELFGPQNEPATFNSNGYANYAQGGGDGDTFTYDQGYGTLEISEGGDTGTANVLQLGAGILPSQVSVSCDSAGDIILTDGTPGDVIQLESMLDSPSFTGGSSEFGVQDVDFANGTVWTAAQLAIMATTGSPTNTMLYGTEGTNVFDSKGDALYAEGNGTADTYIYDQGYGALTIDEMNAASAILQFGPGITAADLTVRSDGDGNLVIGDGIQGDQITMVGPLLPASPDNPSGVGEVEFSDGTTLSLQDLINQAMTGSPTNTKIYGPLIYGRDNVSTTFDSMGYATYEQGAGGTDIFKYDAGYGKLTIYEQGWSSSPVSQAVLEFGPGITASDLTVSNDGFGDLVISDGTAGDQITLQQALDSSFGDLGGYETYGVGEVEFADGSTLSNQQLIDMSTTGSPTNTRLLGSFYGGSTFDSNGYATYEQGYGEQGYGGDTFIYNQGYGALEINESNGSDSVLQFGAGITESDLTATIDSSGDIILYDGVTGDQIKLDGELAMAEQESTAQGVGEIQFADGTTLSAAGLMGLLSTTGSPTNTALLGTSQGETFNSEGYATYAQGAGGSDTFVYDQGYGALEINEPGGTYGIAPPAILELGAGISASDLSVSETTSGALVIMDGTAGDQITLDNELNGDGIGEIEFADGSTMSYQQLMALAATGSATNTWIYGPTIPETVDSKGFASYENGSFGADTFVYDAGYGALEIYELNFTGATPPAVLQFGSGISASDLTFSDQASGALVITDGTSGDQITLDGELTGNGVGEFTFADGTTLSYDQILTMAATGSATNTQLYGTSTPTTFDPMGFATYVQGNSGADTFIYNAGYGAVEIDENGGSSGILQFGSGISASDLTFSDQASGALVITDGTSGDQITLDGELTGNGVGEFTFADGTTLSYDQIMTAASTGSATNTQLYGTSTPTTFDPMGFATYVQGNSGADTFIYNAGYGAVEIDENGGSSGILQFGSGISASDLTFSDQASGALVITDGTSGDQITLDGELTGNGVGEFTFADGTTLSYDQILTMASTGSATNTQLYGTSTPTTFDPMGFATYVQGNSGADTFIYNAGYGAVEIDENNGSNGVLQFGAGISESDLTASADGNGDIILYDGVTGDAIKLDGELDLAENGWASQGVSQFDFTDGTTMSASELLGLLSTTGSATNTSLIATSPGEIFNSEGYATYAQGAGGNDVFIYDSGYGSLEINETDAPNSVLQLGAGIAPSDLSATIDSSGDIILYDGVTGDKITLDNELNSILDSNSNLGVGKIEFANGTLWLASNLLGLLSPTGSPTNTGLYAQTQGQTFNSNGYATYAQGTGGYDTFIYDPGYGSFEISEVSFGATDGVLEFGTGITPGNVILTANGEAGNLLLTDGVAGDQIKILGSLSEIQFANGTTWSLQNLSDLVANESYTLTAGTGNLTYDVAGEGAGAVNGTEIGNIPLQIGTGIDPSDVIFQADSNGDLTVLLESTGDSVTFQHDLSTNAWGEMWSVVQQIDFADGTSIELNELSAPLTFTWIGSTTDTTLTGSNFGSNVFDLGPGSDVVTGGNQNNSFEYSSQVGQATISVSGGSGITNELDFGTGVSDEDLWFTQSGNDLDIKVLGAASEIVVQNWFSGSANQLQEITADGLELDSRVAQLVAAMATYSANNPGFNPVTATQMPSDSALQTEIAAAWHS